MFKDVTTEQLKAAAYDLINQIEICRARLAQLNAEIATRMSAPPAKPSEDPQPHE